MELILLENILNLGNIGDKVKVKSGYGRNFLLKKGKGIDSKAKEELLFQKNQSQKSGEGNSFIFQRNSITEYLLSLSFLSLKLK